MQGDRLPGCERDATRPWDPDPALELSFRKDNSFKSQIVRETPLTDAAKNMNTIFHSMLPANSVWQNYMLLSTQWPSAFDRCTSLHVAKCRMRRTRKTDFLKQPDMTCSPAPTFLANSTLETYSQGEVPLASSSCIACHGNAVGFQRGASNRRTRQAEPEPIGFHVHAGKGAVGRPASSTAISWTVMVGSTMGTLPKDRHNDRPGATPLEHDELIFAPRHARRHGGDDCGRRPSLPSPTAAYAAGPDVNSPQDMMAFLLLSEALTGVTD